MLPDRVSNPGPLTYESDALPIALRGPATGCLSMMQNSRKEDLRVTQMIQIIFLIYVVTPH